MIALNYNFSHPVAGNISYRKLGDEQSKDEQLHFDSEGLLDFDISLPIQEDGNYLVSLNWEYENRLFFHQDQIRVRSGQVSGRLFNE